MTSKIKVDNINKVSDDSNIINKCGTTITLGASGDSIALASGASQTGFGRTGTVDWITTPKVTGDSPVTGVSGKGYFMNTTAGTITLNLPAGSAGDIVSVQDYNNTFDTHNLTIDPNGSEKINGGDAGKELTLSTEGQGLTLVYVDGTIGWRSVHSDDFSEVPVTPAYVAASGGNATLTSGDYKSHVFTGPGTFTVSCAGNVAGSNTVDYLVVAGGGAAGGYYAAAGAGGFRISNGDSQPAPTMSPLSNPTGLPVTATGYPVTVGAGGTAHPCAPGIGAYDGNNGSNSIFAGSSTITSAGGGKGSASGPTVAGGSGGSGGNSGYFRPACGQGAGNTPPVSPPQGNPAGRSSYANGGGGGGAGAAGADGTINGSWSATPTPGPNVGGAGGIGSYIADSTLGPTAPSYGEPGPASNTRYFAGGGGGGVCQGQTGPSGAGGAGGGADGKPNTGPFGTAQNGVVNTGGGGGGSGGGTGGSGIVIIRYKFQ